MIRRKTCRIRIGQKEQKQLQKISAKTDIPVSTLVRRAIKRYLKHRNRFLKLRQMKKGYIAMGAINRALANEAVYSDEQQFFTYEHFLSESE